MQVGDRVQMHPASSFWMQGDRYGVVVGFGKIRQYRAFEAEAGDINIPRPVWVELDISGRTVRVHPDNVFPI